MVCLGAKRHRIERRPVTRRCLSQLSSVVFFFLSFGGSVTWNPSEAHGARGLVPEHVHGSVIFSENARIATQKGKALWDRKDRKPKEDLAQTSRNCLPARRKIDVAFYPCHFLPPYDSGGGKAGQRSTGTDGSRQRHARRGSWRGTQEK
ncbi:hypothetical protein V8E53_012082 [Lactarius tabidus]